MVESFKIGDQLSNNLHFSFLVVRINFNLETSFIYPQDNSTVRFISHPILLCHLIPSPLVGISLLTCISSGKPRNLHIYLVREAVKNTQMGVGSLCCTVGWCTH